MGRLQIPRMVAAGSAVSAATAVRVGAGWVGLWAQRTPSLVALALAGTLGGGDGQAAARQAAFRDGLLALARESAERSWRELRRAVDDLDEHTRLPDVPSPGRTPPRPRPYRVKP